MRNVSPGLILTLFLVPPVLGSTPPASPGVDRNLPATVKDNTAELDDYMKSYREAAEAGLPMAQYNLGAAYRWGVGVPQDQAEAVKWIRRAAENGHTPAQRVMGNLCERGEGIPKSDDEAIRWYRLAVQGGDKQAKDDLNALRERLFKFKK